jgi:glycosyltransferase involved in cell wall biosynthesis
MRIGVLASIAHRTPPRDYGPWEQVAATLTEGFVAAGHEVTLYATADSVTSATLRSVAATGYEEDPGVDPKVWGALHIARAFEDAGDLDVLANHFDFPPLTYSRLVSTPVVTTIHGFSSPQILPAYREYDDIAHYVAISDADRHPDLHYAATIHHGIDTGGFTVGDEPRTHLLFLGRIHPDKGTHRAIEVADRTGLPLTIAGIIQDRAYFDDAVRPHLDGRSVSYVGPVGAAERRELLSSAAALLHLIEFEEPFGLSVVEALASGTPVIAHPRGSLPEILRHGETGFLVSDVGGAVAAVRSLDQIDRNLCRADAVERFDQQRMVREYLELFGRIAPATMTP